MDENQAERDIEKLERDLVERIEVCRSIYDGLINNQHYQALVKDFSDAAYDIDRVWHLERNPERLQEFRITKMAAMSLVGALDSYKLEIEKAKEQLRKIKDAE